jgi:glycosyltransferase involved in cell wall biosynthesis
VNLLFYFGGFAPVGGIETSSRNLLCELKRRNFRPTLVCWGSSSHLLEELKTQGITIKRSFWRWGCRFNIPDWVLLPLAMRALRESDAVLFGKPVPLAILNILRRLNGGRARFILITPYKPEVPKEELQRLKVLRVYEPYDCVWVQGALFEKNLRAIGYRNQMEVIPYMLERTKPATPFPGGSIRIGFIGRLVEDKNIPLLIEAFGLFRRQWSSTLDRESSEAPTLEIYGDGPLRSRLEGLVTELGHKSSIRFHGAVPQHEVPRAVAMCHVFVFASRTEGQCLAALEILACGRPIVATGVGAFPDILTDPGLGRLVEESTAQCISDAISEVTDSILALSISPDVVQSRYRRQFDADNLGARYAGLLRSAKILYAVGHAPQA